MASSPIAPQSSPTSSLTDNILTPSRKVQALLARFDDSDSDDSMPVPTRTPRKDVEIANAGNAAASESSEDEDVPINRPNRMLARLQGNQADDVQNQSTVQTSHSTEQSRNVPSPRQEPTSSPADDSEDELSRPQPRKRLLLKHKSDLGAPLNNANEVSPPPSPLSFPSPTAERTTRSSPPSQTETRGIGSTDKSPPVAASKFKALVEKHRKARIEKEAAEVAKAALSGGKQEKNHKNRRQRGSSPADDSDEGSDDSNIEAAQRLTKDAKPTRKASKKALEEMKRETQRMSRNMQLAHQARTKKKVTKESLLALFNFSVPQLDEAPAAAGDQSATASSEIDSDSEPREKHDTPPTSPLVDSYDLEKPTVVQQNDNIEGGGPSAADIVIEAPPLNYPEIDRPQGLDKGKGKALDWIPQEPVEAWRMTTGQPHSRPFMPDGPGTLKSDTVAKLSGSLKRRREEYKDDGLDDLEIITAKGEIRKYAVFERLSKRKAKETPSHLALRSLAQLHDSERTDRSSMSSSELAASLRKAARMQAIEERQQKIAELRAKGVIVQTAEEREQDQQEVEDLVERARQEAAEISKREKEMAKKDGTFVSDGLDDGDESDDEEFVDEIEDNVTDESEAESENEDHDDEIGEEDDAGSVVPEGEELVNDQADEGDGENPEADTEDDAVEDLDEFDATHWTLAPRRARIARVVSDDEEDEAVTVDSPVLPQRTETPQSLTRSARKQIPGLQMSDDLPLGLTQAFAATMADSQSQTEEQSQPQSTVPVIRDLPSPNIGFAPNLIRLDSVDIVSDSQPATQTQPLNVNLNLSQFQQIPESPSAERELPATQFTPSQVRFEPTQDGGYMYSPFQGNRFASETPKQGAPNSTVDTVIMPQTVDASPILQRRGRLHRGRAEERAINGEAEADKSVFSIMRNASKKAEAPAFDKSKSKARNVIDEAAEESDDEYAGLGGASDDEVNDEENDDDREMIDHDIQVGEGDEAKLAGLFADRERKSDEAAVSKLLKDITTGALRRKRGANDDLDLSDEEDAVARRREAKRREFAKMRRELLKDEAVGKIAEDKKKEAFLKSIEDRELASDEDEDDIDQVETPTDDSQDVSQPQSSVKAATAEAKQSRPLEPASDSQLNRLPAALRRSRHNQKPSTLAEIRESVSFLIEEPDSQANIVDLGLSDSDSEPEAYVDLDRHLQAAEADENAALTDDDDLDDFIVDDDGLARDKLTSQSQDSVLFKKPTLPSQSSRASFAERRTRPDVVNRLSLLRKSSSNSSTGSTTKLAFQALSSSGTSVGFKVPSLLRRATTNSSVSSMSSSDNVSSTGVTTKTERGHVSQEKEFIRKGTGGRRNAVNYRPTPGEEKMSARAGVQKKVKAKAKGAGKGGFLGGLFGGGGWS